MKEQKGPAVGPGAGKDQGPRCGTVTAPRPAMPLLAPPQPNETVRVTGVPLPVLPRAGLLPRPLDVLCCPSLCKSHIPLDRGSRDAGHPTIQETQLK